MSPAAVLTPEDEKTVIVHYGEMPPNCHAEQYEFCDAYVIDMHAVERELARYRAENSYRSQSD